LRIVRAYHLPILLFSPSVAQFSFSFAMLRRGPLFILKLSPGLATLLRS